jgi:hypothetical protein
VSRVDVHAASEPQRRVRPVGIPFDRRHIAEFFAVEQVGVDELASIVRVDTEDRARELPGGVLNRLGDKDRRLVRVGTERFTVKPVVTPP